MTEFVMVSREPTEAMVEAGLQPWLNKGVRKGASVVRGVYLAMVAASPQPVVGDREAVADARNWLHYAIHEDWTPDSHALACCALDRLDAVLASLASRPEGDQELSALQAASQPSVPGGNGDGVGVSGHTPECWGRTSYSDEMTHCYCAKPSEADTLAVLLDNLVIAQSLSRELRDQALDQARSYLYDRRQRLAAQPDTSPLGMEREARNAPILPPPSGEGG